MSKGINNLLCDKHFSADRAMLTLCQARGRAGRCNCRINDLGVSKRSYVGVYVRVTACTGVRGVALLNARRCGDSGHVIMRVHHALHVDRQEGVTEADGHLAVKGFPCLDGHAIRERDALDCEIRRQHRQHCRLDCFKACAARQLDRVFGQVFPCCNGGILGISLDFGHGKAAVLPGIHGCVNRLLRDHGVFLWQLANGLGHADVGQHVAFHTPLFGHEHFRKG